MQNLVLVTKWVFQSYIKYLRTGLFVFICLFSSFEKRFEDLAYFFLLLVGCGGVDEEDLVFSVYGTFVSRILLNIYQG